MAFRPLLLIAAFCAANLTLVGCGNDVSAVDTSVPLDTEDTSADTTGDTAEPMDIAQDVGTDTAQDVGTGDTAQDVAADTAQDSDTAPTVVAVRVAPEDASVPAGLTRVYQAHAAYSDDNELEVTTTATWVIGDEAIATIDATGLATGVASGVRSVTATFAGLSDEAELVVTPPRLDRIDIVEGDALTTPGTTRQYTARGHYSDGSSGSVVGTLAWSTGDASVATIDGGTGLATITGAAGDTTTVTVDLIDSDLTDSVDLHVDRFVYAATLRRGDDASAITAYRAHDITGVPTAIDTDPTTAGNRARGLAVHPTGRFVYAATAGAITATGSESGAIDIFAVDLTNGGLSPQVATPLFCGGR